VRQRSKRTKTILPDFTQCAYINTNKPKKTAIALLIYQYQIVTKNPKTWHTVCITQIKHQHSPADGLNGIDSPLFH
jgi:hypothetical protein